jgi:hypothetical protein
MAEHLCRRGGAIVRGVRTPLSLFRESLVAGLGVLCGGAFEEQRVHERLREVAA